MRAPELCPEIGLWRCWEGLSTWESKFIQQSTAHHHAHSTTHPRHRKFLLPPGSAGCRLRWCWLSWSGASLKKGEMSSRATTDAIQKDWKEREMIEIVHLNILKVSEHATAVLLCCWLFLSMKFVYLLCPCASGHCACCSSCVSDLYLLTRTRTRR